MLTYIIFTSIKSLYQSISSTLTLFLLPLLKVFSLSNFERMAKNKILFHHHLLLFDSKTNKYGGLSKKILLLTRLQEFKAVIIEFNAILWL